MKSKLPLGVLALAIIFSSGAASAQVHRFDLGLNAGAAYWTKILDGEETSGEALEFSPGWLLGSQATLWPTRRIGVRANGAWTYRSVKQGSAVLHGDINLFGLTGDLMFRLRDPGAGSYTPFIALGAGGRWVRPAGSAFLGVDYPNQKYWEGAPITAGNGAEFFIGELTTLMGLASVGADFGRKRVGLRVEVGDRIFHPHFHRILGRDPANPSLLPINPDGDEKLGGWVHELFAQLGVHLRLGGAYPEVVARAAPAQPVTPAAPQPAPTPMTMPPPPPPPAEERVSVCVIEPDGVRTIDAVYRPMTRDTVIMSAGNRAMMRSTLPALTLGTSASWFTSGAPVQVSAGPRKLEWTIYGSPRVVSGNLIALGTIDSVPIYAAASDVTQIRARFEGKSATPLATTLGSDRALWSALEDVRSLYIPVEQIGCRFQELQVRRPATKG